MFVLAETPPEEKESSSISPEQPKGLPVKNEKEVVQKDMGETFLQTEIYESFRQSV